MESGKKKRGFWSMRVCRDCGGEESKFRPFIKGANMCKECRARYMQKQRRRVMSGVFTAEAEKHSILPMEIPFREDKVFRREQ